MKIAVVGAGYVGLSNAALLAQSNQVYIIDILPDKVDKINNKQSPIADSLLEYYLQHKNLNLTALVYGGHIYKDMDYILIATPTDYNSGINSFDTTSVQKTLDDIALTNTKAAIIIKSTVPVGYTNSLAKQYAFKHLYFSPEFLREGSALHDSLHPSRIIVGTTRSTTAERRKAKQFIELLRQGALKKSIPTLISTAQEAEAVKLFANTYLALRIAFFNELDTYAELAGMSSDNIVKGVCLDPRIGDHYNNPSFGYGGYCLPKDTKQLLANYEQVPNNIITAVVNSNNTRKDFIAQRILSHKPRTVGVYRLTTKSGSDNFRDSAIFGVIERLQTTGINIIVYEPMLSTIPPPFNFTQVEDLSEFKNNADIIIANRITPEIVDVMPKVYSRDLFARD